MASGLTHPWAIERIPQPNYSQTFTTLRFSNHLSGAKLSQSYPGPYTTGLGQLQGVRPVQRRLPGRKCSPKITRDPQVAHSYNVFEKDPSNWEGLQSHRLKRDRSSLNSANFYTALTRRTPRDGADGFEALTAPPSSIPQLLDPPGVATRPPRTDIGEWRRQVIKEVESRPKYAVPAARLPKRQFDLSGDFEDVIQGPQAAFYHAHHSLPARTYQVNPEWISERVRMHRSKASQSSGLVMPFGA